MHKRPASVTLRNKWIAAPAALLVFFFSVAWAQSTDPLIRADAPDRYTVVKGDTLWDIAARFLNDPWRWTEIWKSNPYINNPDLIYPGDSLVLVQQDGRPALKALRRETVRLQPQIYSEGRERAIPTIEPSAIQAFLTSPLIIERDELETAGYVASGVNEALIMGKYDQLYVRGIGGEPGDQFRVFRPGKIYRHPITNDILGQEAKHIGDVRLLRHGAESSKVTVLSANEEIALGDRLRPVPTQSGYPYFYPVPAPDDVRAQIIDFPLGLGEAGAFSTIVISAGLRDGVEPGSVFRIYRAGVIKQDPVTGEQFELPEENVGLAMVFRAFDTLGFALVTNAFQPIMPGDTLISPTLSGLAEQAARMQHAGETVAPTRQAKDMDGQNQRKEKSLWRRLLDKIPGI